MKRQMQSSIIILLVVVLFSILIVGCSGGGGSTSISNNNINPDPSSPTTNPIPTNSFTPNPTTSTTTEPTHIPTPNPTMSTNPTPEIPTNADFAITNYTSSTITIVNQQGQYGGVDKIRNMASSLSVSENTGISFLVPGEKNKIQIFNYWVDVRIEKHFIGGCIKKNAYHANLHLKYIPTETEIVNVHLVIWWNNGPWFGIYDSGSSQFCFNSEATTNNMKEGLQKFLESVQVPATIAAAIALTAAIIMEALMPAIVLANEGSYPPNPTPEPTIDPNPDPNSSPQPPAPYPISTDAPQPQPIETSIAPPPSTGIYVGDGTDYSQKFRDCYSQNGGLAENGEACERAHWEPYKKVVVQRLRGGNHEYSMIIHYEGENPNNNAYCIFGKSLQVYEAMGLTDSDLGVLRSNCEGMGLNGTNGTNFRFESGIISKNGDNCYPIYKDYFNIWSSSKENYGWPISKVETVLIPQGKGENQYFDRRVIMKSQSGTFYMTYIFFNKWVNDKIVLGFPTSNIEYLGLSGNSGENQKYQNGIIINWNKGCFTVKGTAYEKWKTNKEKYGLPTSDEFNSNNKLYQQFVNELMEI